MILSVHKLKVVTFVGIGAHRIGIRVRLSPSVKFLVSGFTSNGAVIADLRYSIFLARRAFLFLFGALSRFAHPVVVLGWNYSNYPDIFKRLSYDLISHVRRWIPGLFTNWDRVSSTALRAEGSLQDIGMIFQFPDVMLIFGVNDRLAIIPKEARIISMPSIMPSEAAFSFNFVNYYIPANYKKKRPTNFFFRLFYSVRDESFAFRRLKYFSVFKQAIGVIYSRRVLKKKLYAIKSLKFSRIFTESLDFKSPVSVGTTDLSTKDLFPYLGYFSYGYLSKRVSTLFFFRSILSQFVDKRSRILFLKKTFKSFKESGDLVSSYKSLTDVFRYSFFPGHSAASRYQWVIDNRKRKPFLSNVQNRLSSIRKTVHPASFYKGLASLIDPAYRSNHSDFSLPAKLIGNEPTFSYWQSNLDFLAPLVSPPNFEEEEAKELNRRLDEIEFGDSRPKPKVVRRPQNFEDLENFSNFHDYKILKSHYPNFSRASLSFRSVYKVRPVEVPSDFFEFLDFLQIDNPPLVGKPSNKRFFRVLTRRLISRAASKKLNILKRTKVVHRFWPFLLRWQRRNIDRRRKHLRKKRRRFLREFKVDGIYLKPIRKKGETPAQYAMRDPTNRALRRLIGKKNLRRVFGPPTVYKPLPKSIKILVKKYGSLLANPAYRLPRHLNKSASIKKIRPISIKDTLKLALAAKIPKSLKSNLNLSVVDGSRYYRAFENFKNGSAKNRGISNLDYKKSRSSATRSKKLKPLLNLLPRRRSKFSYRSYLKRIRAVKTFTPVDKLRRVYFKVINKKPKK